MMNFDDFEQRLARTPVPAPPAELRREVLDAIHRERERARAGAVRETRPSAAATWAALAHRFLRGWSSPWTVFGGAWVGVAILASVGTWLDAGRPGAPSVAISPMRRPTRLEIVKTLQAQRAETAALASFENASSGDGEETVVPPSTPVPGSARPRTESGSPKSTPEESQRHDVV